MRRDRVKTILMSAVLAVSGLALTEPASAQDIVRHRPAAHRLHRVAAAETPVTYRGLTINRPPDSLPPARDDDQDIYQDGPVRYNDIRDFSPAPYTTSGVQYPYGLDGIGGYGSGFDIGSGQDAALYNRGAGTP